MSEVADKRLIYLEKYYNQCDGGNKGYLNISETKKFLTFVLNLNYKNEDDKTSFKKVMRIVDPKKTSKVQKDVLMNFFMEPGFIDQIRPEEIKVIELEFND